MVRRTIWAILLCIALSSLSYSQEAQGLPAVDAYRLQQLGAAITSKYESSLVCVAVVSRKQEQRVFDNFEAVGGKSFILEPTNPSFIASRYVTGLALSKTGDILVPYSSLGEPTTHAYFVWHKGSVAHGTMTAVKAEVVSGEPYSNLAVLHVLDESFGGRLEPLMLQEMKEPVLGESCLRISCDGGYPLSGVASIEWGTVTALKRSVLMENSSDKRESDQEQTTLYAHAGTFQTSHTNYTDMAGSMIVNIYGEVIGVSIDPLESTVIHSSGSYALPTDRVFRRIASALRLGKLPEFGFLGIQPNFVEQGLQRRQLRGALVASVIDGMPGDIAGLRVGDVITQIGDRVLESRDAIFRELAAYGPGDKVPLVVRRPRSSDILHVDTEVVLSKRYITTKRPSYTTTPEQRLSGALIDFATAFPPELLFQYYTRYSNFDPQSVAVMDVSPGSVGWEAGLRVGQKILSIDNQKVLSPQQAFDLIRGKSQVELTIQDLQGRVSSVRLQVR